MFYYTASWLYCSTLTGRRRATLLTSTHSFSFLSKQHCTQDFGMCIWVVCSRLNGKCLASASGSGLTARVSVCECEWAVGVVPELFEEIDIGRGWYQLDEVFVGGSVGVGFLLLLGLLLPLLQLRQQHPVDWVRVAQHVHQRLQHWRAERHKSDRNVKPRRFDSSRCRSFRQNRSTVCSDERKRCQAPSKFLHSSKYCHEIFLVCFER